MKTSILTARSYPRTQRGRRRSHLIIGVLLSFSLVAFLLLGNGIIGSRLTLFKGTSSAKAYGPIPDGKYDYNTFLLNGGGNDFERIFHSLFILKTKTEFRTPDGQVYHMNGQTTGIVLFGRYVLTVNHGVSAYELVLESPFTRIVIPASRTKEETFIVVDRKMYPLYSLLRDRDADVALFRLPGDLLLPSFPHKIGNSDELKIGNYLYVVGNPMNIGINVREGIVSGLKGPQAIKAINFNRANTFMVSNGVNPGDSGTPVIAIRDGRFELVGMTQGTIENGQRLGWVLRINAVMERIRPYLKETHNPIAFPFGVDVQTGRD